MVETMSFSLPSLKREDTIKVAFPILRSTTWRGGVWGMEFAVAVVISHDPGLHWSFTLIHDGTQTTHTSESIEIDEMLLALGYGPIDSPVAIEPGKEIVLYTALYSDGSIRAMGDLQAYIEQPELLADYPFAHLIKCRFE
jgi:hypothetical protein